MSAPFTFADRSPFDGIRLRWGSVGDIVLGIGLIGGVGGVGGIIFGILFILLGATTLIITRFGSTSWYEMPTSAQVFAGVGSIIGLVFLILFFFWLFLIWMLFKHIILPTLGS